MKQGILNHGRVKLLMKKGQSCYKPGRTGERKRKSVRGCIVNHNLSILNLAIVKKGEGEIEGLTDKQIPRRLVQRELTTSESSLLWTNLIQSHNTSSERPLKRMERQNLLHQRFNVLSLQSPFNANAEEWLTRDHVLNKPRRPKLSTESSLLNVPRMPRKRRRNEDDHPSPNLLILLAQTEF